MYLYRYFSIDNKYDHSSFEKLLLHNELGFVSPRKFNDPFDCKLNITFNSSNESDWREYKRWALKIEHPNIEETEIDNLANTFIKNGRYKEKETRDSQKDVFTKTLENLTSKYFIASFCQGEKPDNLLMWSHYANGHSGYCLQFDLNAFPVGDDCYRVNYFNKYGELNELNTLIKETNWIDLFLTRKSDIWKYENEWRFIWQDDNEKGKNIIFREIPENAITGIVYGCNLPENNKRIKINLLAHRKIPIKQYEAMKKGNEYGLDIKELPI